MQVNSRAAGQLLATWGGNGSEPGQLPRPRAIAVAPDGSVYVADTGNHRIQRFSSDGAWLASWGREGPRPGEFREVRALAVDSAGSVWVADAHNHRVQKFTADGAFVAEWGERGRSRGAFIFPSGLVVDNVDRVYVADRSNYRIQVIAPDGTFEPAIAAGYVSLGRRAIIGPLAWAPGSLYTADRYHHVVLRHDLQAVEVR